jgi:hypothetical protein
VPAQIQQRLNGEWCRSALFWPRMLHLYLPLIFRSELASGAMKIRGGILGVHRKMGKPQGGKTGTGRPETEIDYTFPCGPRWPTRGGSVRTEISELPARYPNRKTHDALHRLLDRIEAGQDGRLPSVPPHCCHATLMLENEADIRVIQKMLGHVELTTTELYTRVSINLLRQVYSATHPRRPAPHSVGSIKRSPTCKSLRIEHPIRSSGLSKSGIVAGATLTVQPARAMHGSPCKSRLSFLGLFREVAIGDHIDGWRVCWIGGGIGAGCCSW